MNKPASSQAAGQTRWVVLVVLFLFLVSCGSYLARADAPPEEAVRPTPAPCSSCHPVKSGEDRTIRDTACQQCHSPHPLNLAENTAPEEPPHAASEESARESTIRQEMVRIPAGEFIMGNNGRGTADGPGNRDETPRRQVFVGTFEIDQYEVTNRMYQEFVEATGHPSPLHWEGIQFPTGKSGHPVVYVNWHDANAFCQWSEKRLPTEAEWEKAARGTDGRIFPWGNTFDSRKANTPQYWLAKGVPEDDLGFRGDTLTVGFFEEGRSPYGLYDMSGNVYEWTASWYLPYPDNQELNIHYGFKNKVLRGGSWYDCLNYGCGLSAPTYNRSRFSPEIRNMGFGFRCARNSGSGAETN